MKPAPFVYRAPETEAEALAVLAEHGDDAKVLAGGQSLVPLLNFRMARPGVLVDINRLGPLGRLRRSGGTLHIGALTREAAVERSALVADHWPVLREAVEHVGHPAIRSRGTVGGSAAHADPTGELPAVLTALDARFLVRSATSERTLDAGSFFVSYLTTALEPDELLVEVQVPAMEPAAGSAFVEYARLHGDFALAGAAAVVRLDAAGTFSSVRLVLLGAGGAPVRAYSAEDALVGARTDEDTLRGAAELAARESEPPAPVDHRRALLADLARRALVLAASRAGTEAEHG